MTKCGDGRHAVCNFCVYLDKSIDPSLDYAIGYCLRHDELKDFTEYCSDFHCFHVPLNDKLLVGFHQAFKWCERGHKVSRVEWGEDCYLFLDLNKGALVFNYKGEEHIPWGLTQVDLLAKDWYKVPLGNSSGKF